VIFSDESEFHVTKNQICECIRRWPHGKLIRGCLKSTLNIISESLWLCLSGHTGRYRKPEDYCIILILLELCPFYRAP